MSDSSARDTPFRVRPYLLTGGRTRATIDLPLEAQITSTEAGIAAIETTSLERRDIIELCRSPQSVGEFSGHRKIHLQVAKVLVGDLVEQGLLSLQSNAMQTSDRPDLQLLNRVLDGLQAL